MHLILSCRKKMPKKKTGARKKAEKQKDRQKNIRDAAGKRDLVECPCNFSMVNNYLVLINSVVFVKYLA